MSNPAALGALSYEAESSWGEDVTTFATYRLQTTKPIDTSGLTLTKIPSEITQQYRQGGSQWIKTTYGGSFTFRLWLTGHGSTMVGSPSVTARETLMGIIFGTAPALSASASTTLTGGTAAAPTTTASGTFSAGSLCRVGSINDTRGNGQMYAIGTHVTTTLNLLGALNGAPTNGDVLYPVVQLPIPESPTSSSNAITPTRWLLQTANHQHECHGCFPMSVSFGLETGQPPFMDVTMGVSWWRYSTATFPSTTSTDTFLPAAIAGGSWNVNTVGTTTRNARSYRNFTLNHTLGVVPLEGPGGINPNQKIVGARRISDRIQITWTEDCEAATTTPALPALYTATNFLHGEFTASAADGTAFGFKCPSLCIVDPVPVQRMDNGLNRITITAEAYTGATTTSELTLAAIVYGMA